MENSLKEIARSAGLVHCDIVTGNLDASETASWAADVADGSAPLRGRFLIASITKPIVAMALLKLAAAGEISLVERIGDIFPAFGKAAFRRITVRHLLTHTSGFADMLPNNAELRAAHADLPEFVAQASAIELDFPTATDCRYSSIGFLLIGAIIEKITGQSLSVFLENEFFEPLSMRETWLGMSADEAIDVLPTVLPCVLPAWQPDAEQWGWNSAYWRTLGAPWGGMISTAGDLSRFAKMMLRAGVASNGKQVLPASVVAAAVSDQTSEIAAQPGYTGPNRNWGFGWRRQWASHSASFGDFLSADAVGHWGATGTLLWVDPQRGNYAVVLSTTPYEDSRTAIQRISNVVSARRHLH